MKGLNFLFVKLLLVLGLCLNLYGAYNAGLVKTGFAVGTYRINADLIPFSVIQKLGDNGYGYWIKTSQNTTIDILGNGVPQTKTINTNK